MKKVYVSSSASETEKIGEEFAQKLKPGGIVLLYGDLGFGKTTFVKGVAMGLGIKTRIISPTFGIIREHNIKYKISNIKNTYLKLKMFHIDLYRIENKKQIGEIGLKEILGENNSVKLVEWAEKMGELPKRYWKIKFEMNKDDTRTIKINNHE